LSIERVEIELPANGWRAREYQRPLWEYLDRGGRHAVAVWHRRAGKDEVALHHACKAAHRRKGNYWHMLPEYKQARKAIWDAINPHTGRKRIDEAFPLELRKSTNQVEMKIEFHWGSIWQVVGSDNFNSLIGSPPVGIVYSEWAVADPRAHGFLRPILAENGGWSLFIYTSRGYNHGFSTYEAARNDPNAFAQRLTALDTPVFTQAILESERKAYMEEYGQYEGDALFRQEYHCDFSAANIGAILGRYVEDADKQGRINEEVEYDPNGGPVILSSDIGFRDTAAWWFWQPRPDGFALIDYEQDTGMDAPDWIERLRKKPYKYETIWLPRDAKAKTFQTKRSALEQFMEAKIARQVMIVPQLSIADRVNAARTVMPSCRFNKTRCKHGLDGLRGWSYEYNDETKTYSKEPKHDWASHPGDGFSYGAQVMRERVITLPKPPEPLRGPVTIGQFIAAADAKAPRRRRI
jgi:phage terminase large subunit